MSSMLRSTLEAIKRALEGDELKIDVGALLCVISEKIERGALSAVDHPVGFMMVDLSVAAGSELGEQFRLHVWSEARKREDGLGSIHDHSWNLTSAVIVGELLDSNFEAREDPGGSGFVRVIYTPGGNEFRDGGNYRLSMIRQRRMRAPVVYKLAPNVLHSTSVSLFPAVTLVIADRKAAGDNEPLVIMENDKVPPPGETMPVIPSGKAANIVSGLVERVARVEGS